MLSAGGVLDGKRYLSASSFRELTTGVNPVNDQIEYGMGWAVYMWNGHRVVEHNGGSEGDRALVSFMPDEHLGFALLINTSPNDLTTIGHAGAQIYPMLLGETAATEGLPEPVVSPPDTGVAPSGPRSGCRRWTICWCA
jgi:hypothetical protein